MNCLPRHLPVDAAILGPVDSKAFHYDVVFTLGSAVLIGFQPPDLLDHFNIDSRVRKRCNRTDAAGESEISTLGRVERSV